MIASPAPRRQTTSRTAGRTDEIAHRRGPQEPPEMVRAQRVATDGPPPAPTL